MKMSVLQQPKNNSFFTPMKIGFIISFAIHAAFLCLLIERFHKIEISEDGVSAITLSLATIQNPSPNESEPKPTPKKPVKKPHKKKPKPIERVPNPIPEELEESQPEESMLAAQANQQNEGDVIETLSQKDGEHNELYQQIQSAIQKKQRYPRMMQKRRIEENEVLVEFVIYTDGRVTNIRVIQPSKFEDFNRASVRAVEEASKHFPRVEKNLRLEIPLAYNLRTDT